MMETKSASDVHIAHLGRRPGHNQTANLDYRRPTMEQLVRRYGMWVHRCVTLNAQTAAAVPFKLMAASGNADAERALRLKHVDPRTRALLRGRSLPLSQSVRKAAIGNMDDLREVVDHPVLDLLHDINEWSDGYSWRESLYADLQIFGRHFSHTTTDTGDRVAEIWRIMPQRVEVLPNADTFVAGFRVGSGASEVILPPDEVLWFKLNDPFNPWGGLGPLEAWLKTVDASFAIQEFQHWLMDRGGAPDYIVKTGEHGMTEPQKKAFRTDWRRLFGRLFARKESVAILDGDADVERLGQTNKELEFQQSEDSKRDQIGQGFGIPKSILASSEIRANSREATHQWMSQTLWPMIQRVEDVLNEHLVPRFSPRLFIMHENPIPEDEAIVIQQRKSKLESGYSVDEVRVEAGDEPLGTPDASEPLVASGLTTLSRAVDPPEPPPPAVGLAGESEDDEDEATSERPANDQRTAVVALQKQVAVLTGLMMGSGVLDTAKNGNLRGNLRGGFAGISEDEFRDMVASIPASKTFSGEVADDSFDGYVNEPFADDMQAAFDEMIVDVVERVDTRSTADFDDPKAYRKAADDPISKTEIDRIMPDDTVLVAWIALIQRRAMPHMETAMETAGQEAMTQLTGLLPAEGGPVELSFQLDNTRVQQYLQDTSRRIGQDQTDKWRKQIREELVKGVDAGENVRQIRKRIEAMTDLTKAAAERVARTETAFASVNGTEQGWAQSGVVEGKQFFLAPDACPICQKVAEIWGSGKKGDTRNKKQALLEPFFELGKSIEVFGLRKDGEPTEYKFDYAPDGKTVTIPPVHPNCRCSTLPIITELVEAEA